MKVKDVMTKPVESCTRSTDLATAAEIMWRHSCGVVPVVSDDGRHALGVITDRDICMASATRHRAPGELQVGQVMTGHLFKVEPEDDLHLALERMRNERVRRLPVVNRNGGLVGVISINDIVLMAEPVRGRFRVDVSANDLLETLKVICAHPIGLQTVVPAQHVVSVHDG